MKNDGVTKYLKSREGFIRPSEGRLICGDLPNPRYQRSIASGPFRKFDLIFPFMFLKIPFMT